MSVLDDLYFSSQDIHKVFYLYAFLKNIEHIYSIRAQIKDFNSQAYYLYFFFLELRKLENNTMSLRPYS
jgi:hypothetical protein